MTASFFFFSLYIYSLVVHCFKNQLVQVEHTLNYAGGFNHVSKQHDAINHWIVIKKAWESVRLPNQLESRKRIENEHTGVSQVCSIFMVFTWIITWNCIGTMNEVNHWINEFFMLQYRITIDTYSPLIIWRALDYRIIEISICYSILFYSIRFFDK